MSKSKKLPDVSGPEAAVVVDTVKPVRVLRTELATAPGAYAAANAMHGWTSHKHHAGAPMALTRKDYLAAIASAYERGEPHVPALSPYYGKRL